MICTKLFPSYTPLTLGETPLDIILPLVEWFLASQGGKAKNKDDLVIGGKVYKKKLANEVNWL